MPPSTISIFGRVVLPLSSANAAGAVPLSSSFPFSISRNLLTYSSTVFTILSMSSFAAISGLNTPIMLERVLNASFVATAPLSPSIKFNITFDEDPSFAPSATSISIYRCFGIIDVTRLYIMLSFDIIPPISPAVSIPATIFILFSLPFLYISKASTLISTGRLTPTLSSPLLIMPFSTYASALSVIKLLTLSSACVLS